MDESILNSTKRILGLSLDDESFDHDVITHINSAFSVIQQLGVGRGFQIQDETSEWGEIAPELPDQEWITPLIKTIVYLRVRILFDPPTTTYLLDALTKQLQEHEWRLSNWREETEWVDPDPPTLGAAA